MFRFFYIFVSALMLAITFSHPRDAENAELNWNKLYLPDTGYEYLFFFCLIASVPMTGVAFYYFLKSFNAAMLQRRFQAGAKEFMVFIIIAIAVYSFDKWVFSELI